MLNSLNFELFLIRHGQSEINAQPDLIGQTSDVKLTKLGEQQAELLGQYFRKNGENFDLVYSSPYLRASETCRIALNNNSVIYDDSLREYSAGDWIGNNINLILTSEVINKMNVLGQTFQPPNGESMNQVERRVSLWLENNFLYNQKFHSLCEKSLVKVAVFCHGMVIKCLLHYIMGFDQSFTWKIKIDNSSVTRLLFKDGWFIKTINNCSHLD